MENKQIIIGLVGPMVAGKGTVAAYLRDKYKASTYGFSGPLRDVLDRLYEPVTRNNMADLSTALRGLFGHNLLSRVITRDIKADQNSIIVLDGIRRLDDIKEVLKLDNFYLVKVTAESRIRYERLTKRTQNQDDGQKTYEQFLADEQAEADKQIPKVMQQAKFELINNGSLDELNMQTDELIKKLNNYESR